MRILVTNDDGVHAPGLAAITRALDAWASAGGPGDDRSVVVVAPLANHSGAAAAVGTVYEREAISYREVLIDGVESVPVYGVDASPALTVIIGALGAFGRRPDVVVSGINLGVNVGRSVLHSGTVGAALTGAQLGLSGLAVSMRSNAAADHWETAAALAVEVLPFLEAAPARTVLNLNVPSVPREELRGVRRGHIGVAGIIKAAADTVRRGPSRGAGSGDGVGAVDGGVDGGVDGEGGEGSRPAWTGAGVGEIRLTLGTAIPQLGELGDASPDDDVALLAAGYASLTPLVGVREDRDPAADAVVDEVLAHLEALSGA